MSNDRSNDKNKIYEKWADDLEELKSFSHDVGWAIGQELLENRGISYSEAEALTGWWKEFGGHEAWRNIHAHLDEDTGRELADIIEERERRNERFDLDEVGKGFFEAVAEEFANFRKQKHACG